VQRERLPTTKYFDRWTTAQVGTTIETSHTGKEQKPTAQYKAQVYRKEACVKSHMVSVL
jgi:hypothetical protein